MHTTLIDNKRPLKNTDSEPKKRIDERSNHCSITNGQLERQITGNVPIETLRVSEKKYRTLVENLPQKIFHKDKNSVYVSCNKKYADDLKIKPLEIVGKTDYDFYPKALAEKYRADDKRVMETGVIETIEEKYVHNGKKLVVQTVKAPIVDEEGNLTGILGIFWDITDRKRMEHKLIKYQTDLRTLASQITFIEEQEREKCAAFLHDSIGQSLSSLKVNLAMHSNKINLKECKTDVDAMIATVNQLIEDTRFLTSALTPPVLYQFGLSAGLEWLVDQMNKREKIMIHFEDDGQSKPLDKNMSTILFRSVNELLINVIKHANAQKAKVSLKRNNNRVRICVEDDGVGFNTEKKYSYKSVSKGFGLFSIEERLNHLGGKFSIVSKPHQGTQAILIAPFRDKTMHH
jgi:PAS domain S-box-containing protein